MHSNIEICYVSLCYNIRLKNKNVSRIINYDKYFEKEQKNIECFIHSGKWILLILWKVFCKIAAMGDS